MNKKYYVYKHTSPSNKVYIGITCMNPIKRWNYGNGYKTQIFYRAIEKYGWENIKHKILFSGLTKQEAEQKEIELIQKYKSTNPKFGYNIDNGGHVHSKATREKLSNSLKGHTINRGRVHTKESKQHMSEAHIGNKLSDETKRKLSEINTGKKYSEETIENIKIAKRKAQSYPVYCIELDMKFDSVPDAVDYINEIGGSVIRQGIQKVINGTMKASGKLEDGTKLHWKCA